MILVIIATILGVTAFVLLWRELAAQNRPKKLSKVAGAAAVALVAILLAMTATGKLHWLAALLAGALPFARWIASLFIAPLIGRLMQSGIAFNPFRGRPTTAGADTDGSDASTNRASTVATADLRMTLNHQSGTMDGEVLVGALAGQRLSALDEAALTQLYNGLTAADSRQLLSAYLDRRFPGWAAASANGETPAAASGMDASQALAVLGLAAGATKADIVEAHRRLMHKLHPDRGGTDYLAATLNRAKEVLLDGR